MSATTQTELNRLITNGAKLIRHKQEIQVRQEGELASINDSIKANEIALIQSFKRAGITETHVTPLGDKATPFETTRYAWDEEKLEDVLSPTQFAVLCPPKADGAKLRKLVENDPDAADNLKKCFTTETTSSVRITPAKD